MRSLMSFIMAFALLVCLTRAANLNGRSGEGNPDDIVYYLYTRSNSLNPYTLEPFDGDSVSNSNMDFDKMTFLQFHGFTDSAFSWAVDAKTALLDQFDCNVISVDWSILAAAPNYNDAAANVYVTAGQTAAVLDWLNSDFGLDFSKLHLTGHSLGAHAAGMTGLYLANGNAARVTGLDPAGPLFYDSGEQLTISKLSGDFVDIMHTNAGDFADGCLGLVDALGHVDFYPDGGEHQDGCAPNIGGDIVDMAQSCSHNRAPEYWIESITSQSPDLFWSWQCENWNTFALGGCDYSCATGVCVQMGYHSNEGAEEGNYYLSCAEESPYALGTEQHN